jgi:thioredoxin-related protein
MCIRYSLCTISFCAALLLFAGCGKQSAESASDSTKPEKEANWLTDYKAALSLAQKENKAVLMDFTGSDWCPPCMVLNKKVFRSDVFKEFADKNLVLLKVDFPQMTPQAPEVAMQNARLAEHYRTQDQLPTVILTDGKGEVLGGMAGYDFRPAGDYVSMLERILAEKPATRQIPLNPATSSKSKR